jgi:radical SAM protein with 4Fe4S-binding SPASM domain
MREIESAHSFVKKNNLKLRLIRYRGDSPPKKEDLKNIYNKYGHFKEIIFDEGFDFCKDGSVCGAIGSVLAISSEGSVYPCTWMRDPLFKLGNIEDNSLKVILNNKKTKEIRKTFAEISACCEEGCPFFKKDECLKTIKDYEKYGYKD